MRPSFLLTPDAFTRGEGVGPPLTLNGGWPMEVQAAFADGAALAFQGSDLSRIAPRAALLSRPLSAARLDHFLQRAGEIPERTRPAVTTALRR